MDDIYIKKKELSHELKKQFQSLIFDMSVKVRL